MKWAVLNFLLFANPIFAEPHNLEPPQLDWGDVVSAYTTKKFISPDGRKWNFRFHQSDAKLPEVLKGHKYRIQLVSKGVENMTQQQLSLQPMRFGANTEKSLGEYYIILLFIS